MNYITGICTDKGIKKAVNQDGVMIKQAKTDLGNILFAVVCDGMGGLAQGEVASATVIAHMENWFEQVFPSILFSNFTPENIKESLTQTITNLNNAIQEYGSRNGIHLGTTLTALLLVEDAYYMCNVGDSRIYYIKDSLQQMTHDQTYVQREMDMGRMTVEEAKTNPQRNMLLQCIGASTKVVPDFYVGEYQADSTFLLCSDGFRHVLTATEIQKTFAPEVMTNQEIIEKIARDTVELVKSRKEEDNISVAVIHAI